MIKYFDKLFEIKPMKMDLGSPLFLSEVAILKNTVDADILLRNIFANIGNKTIIAISVHIRMYDIFGSQVTIDGKEELDYLYQDIEFSPGSCYGNKVAIPLPENVRKVEVNIDKFVTIDGVVWKYNSENQVTVQNQTEIDYPEEFYKEIEETGKPIIYFYTENDTCWQCTCGQPNYINSNLCECCGRDKQFVKEYYNQKNLDVLYDSFTQRIKEEEEIAKAKEEEEKNLSKELTQNDLSENSCYKQENKNYKKRKNIFFIFGIFAIILVIIILVVIKNSSNTSKTSKFNKMEKSELVELNATETIEKLSTYCTDLLDVSVNMIDDMDEIYSDDSDGKITITYDQIIIFERNFKNYLSEVDMWINDMEKYLPEESFKTDYELMLKKTKEFREIIVKGTKLDSNGDGDYDSIELNTSLNQLNDNFQRYFNNLGSFEEILNKYYISDGK